MDINVDKHHEVRFVTESLSKISCRSSYYFQIYGHLNILQIWLKTLIPALKIYVFGGFDP